MTDKEPTLAELQAAAHLAEKKFKEAQKKKMEENAKGDRKKPVK